MFRVLQVNINVKSDKTKVKQCRRDFRKGNYKEIRKRLTLIDWNGKMKNKTAAECWNIVRVELDNAIDSYVPMKKQGKRSKKNICQKRLSERLDINKICGGFINIRERIQIIRGRISSKNLLVRRTSGFAKPLVHNEIHLSHPRKS